MYFQLRNNGNNKSKCEHKHENVRRLKTNSIKQKEINLTSEVNCKGCDEKEDEESGDDAASAAVMITQLPGEPDVAVHGEDRTRSLGARQRPRHLRHQENTNDQKPLKH